MRGRKPHPASALRPLTRRAPPATLSRKGRGFALAALASLAFAGSAHAQDQIAHGQQVFQYWCATCHGRGPGHPGTDALQAKYHGSKPALLEERRDLTPDQVRFFVRHGITIMPFFRKTEISDADLDAIGAYLSRKR